MTLYLSCRFIKDLIVKVDKNPVRKIMDILGIPLWLVMLTVFMASLVWYAWNMSKDLNVFERLGIGGPPPFPIVGNLGIRYWMDGMFKSQIKTYQKFKDRKFYGTFDANVPVLHIKDCDVIQDVLVTNFDHFVDRPNRFHGDPFMEKCTNYIRSEKWRKTRNIMNSSLNPTSLQYATTVIQRATDALMNFLKPKIDWRRKVHLSGLSLLYSIDVHSGFTFGGDYQTFQNVYGRNADNLERLLKESRRWRLASVFFTFLSVLLRICRVSVIPKSALKYFRKQVDRTLKEYHAEGDESESRQCFLGSMATGVYDMERAGGDNGNNNKGNGKTDPNMEFSYSDIEAQAFTVVHSGLDKVSSILSLTLFQLANNPTICEKVQREIDECIGSQTPDEKSIQTLTYLDQCIQEIIRMYPPFIAIDRICTKDISIQGIRIPKNMIVRIPIYSLHRDPSIWRNPDSFHPERFHPSINALRHPFTFLPFGSGPRNCPGMRLSLLEIKMVLVHMLRVMTPIPCPQTVYPIKIKKWKMEPEDDLCVKVRPRFWLGVCEYPPSSVLA